MQRKTNLLRSLDWPTILLYAVMVICGWFTIYAACYDFEHSEVLDFSMRHGMQLIWIASSVVLATLVLLIDSKFYSSVSYVLYGAMLLLLILTIFLSPDIKGSHSWLKIGAFSVQPAEFAKYATALCLSHFMSAYQFNMYKPRNIITIALIVLVPMAIIILQSETGSALVFTAFLLPLFREGMNGIIVLLGLLAVVLFIVVLRFNNLPLAPGEVASPESYGFILAFVIAILVTAALLWHYTRDKVCLRYLLLGNLVIAVTGGALHYFLPEAVLYTRVAFANMGASALYLLVWAIVRRRRTYLYLAGLLLLVIGGVFSVDYAFDRILEPHQQIRIKIVLGLEDDPQGAGYNVHQSQIAIGSGGFAGKGFLAGTQTKLNYVPEQDTDFIFCTIGEEWGFVGTTFIVLLFSAFIIRLVVMAERQRSTFARIYGYCVAGVFLFHFTINIGMVIGLLPVIGIPLPFFSYGGSSLWGFTLLLFTFLRLDANRMEILQEQ